MTRYISHPMPGMPAAGGRHREAWLLLNVPIWVAAGFGAAVMLVRSTQTFVENLRSDPGQWQGLVSLAGILLATSVCVILACAAVGAVIGCLLRALFRKSA